MSVDASGHASQPATSHPSHRLGVSGRLAAVMALAIVAGLVVFSEWAVCPFARISGQPCPGCGMTRAALALLSLDWGQALRWHPLSPICVPLVVVLSAEGTVSYVQQRNVAWTSRLVAGSYAGWVWGALGTALVAIWVLRFWGFFGGPVSV